MEIHAAILLGKIFAAGNEYDSAIIYYNLALKYSKEIEDDQLETDALIGLGEIYSSQMQYDLAYNNYYQALLKALKTENEIQLSNIYLYNINGQLVMEKQDVKGSCCLDISNLKNGTYIVKIISDKEIFTSKLNIIK